MINLSIDNSVANIVLDKSPLNIFSYKDIIDLANVINSINKEDNIALVVIKSANNNFSAGMDIKEHDKNSIHNILISLEQVIEALINSQYTTISLVKGYCLGGGLEIALFTDIIVASSNAKFALPEIQLAHLAPFGLSLLPVILPYKRATEFILSGNTIDADNAFAMGIVSKLVDASKFEEVSLSYINDLLNHSYNASFYTTKILRNTLRQAMDYYRSNIKPVYSYDILNHPDSQEGINAFLEHRKPIWQE